MHNRYGVISCSLFLLLIITVDNAAAKKPHNSAEVSAISLDVLRVKACAVGQGCSTVGGPKQWDLFDLAEGKTDFANQVLMPAKTYELRLMLGSKSTITVDGQTYPLRVPSGQVSGLKMIGKKLFVNKRGFLKSIRLNFDPAKWLVVQAKKVKGKGKKDKDTLVYSYSLKPVIQVSAAEVTPMPENMAAVVALPEKDVTLKFGSDFSMLIPAGAVSTPLVIKAEKTEGITYAVSPEGMFFNKPIIITLGYDISLFTDAGYENPEEKLSILMDGVGIFSVADTQAKKITTAALDLTSFRVGIISEYPYQHKEIDESNYSEIEMQESRKILSRSVDYIQSESNSSYDINDNYCQKKDISFDLTREELENSEFMSAVNKQLKKDFIDMYIALSNDGKLRNLWNSHSIYTCRSARLAHKYSTGANIYNKHVTLQRIQEWAKGVTAEKNYDVKDKDTNVWYNLSWPSKADSICKILQPKYSSIITMEKCKEYALTTYLRRQAKKNANDIVQKSDNSEDIIPGAEEGYGDENKSRRLPNIQMRISSHVTGEAVDLSGVKWDSFVGGKWSDEAVGFVGKYGLYRPYQPGVTRSLNPNGVIGEEWWHFEVDTSQKKVNSVSPSYATLGASTTFTVYGQNLPSTLALNIDGCNNMLALGGTPTLSAVAATSMNFSSSSNTFTSRFFSCTPSSAGVKTCSVMDTQGGNILYESTVDFDAANPTVSSVSPSKATLDQPTTFTVSGENLPSTLAFSLYDCKNITSLGGTSTSMRFSCTPGYSYGVKTGQIKDAEGGEVLYSFNVDVTGPPKVTSITPNTATLNELNVFTVSGQNLPSTLAFWIDECENVAYLGGSSVSMQFSCTPSWTTGEKNGVIRAEAGGNILDEFTVNVAADAAGTCASGPQTATWQGREWQRCDDNWEYTYEAAKDYCGGLILDGYSDWRLPTKDELKSLVVCTNGTSTPLADYPTTPWDCGIGNSAPYAKPTLDSSFVGRSTVYWSSTVYDATKSWTVGFGNGYAYPEPYAIQNAVRCVR